MSFAAEFDVPFDQFVMEETGAAPPAPKPARRALYDPREWTITPFSPVTFRAVNERAQASFIICSAYGIIHFVKSDSGACYRVDSHGCECADHAHRGGERLCKHSAAVASLRRFRAAEKMVDAPAAQPAWKASERELVEMFAGCE